MNLYIEPIFKHSKILNKVSAYSPSKKVKERIQDIRRDYQTADRIRNATYEEFNNLDLISYMNNQQRAFNSYIPAQSSNPDEAWRANTVRPITRNKVISFAAHIAASLLYPNTIAQNQRDVDDKEAAMVMRDLMDFSWTESQYEKTMVFGIISALFNPCLIIEEGYARVKRMIKDIQEDGSWKEKIIEDDEFSGFYNSIIPPDQLYIGNFYEHNIQKQPFLIKRRVLDYNEAKLKYQEFDDFQYVEPGIRFFYADERDQFYQEYDEEIQDRQVEEVTYYNRYSDLELRIINGVLMDDPDRPMQRKDKRYPFAHGIFEPFDEGMTFYGKPLTDKIAPDQNLADTLYNISIDAAHLQAIPPAMLFGEEELDSSVVVPGKITTGGMNTRFETVNSNVNMAPALNMLEKVEQSISESSMDPFHSGQTMQGGRTAFEMAQLQQNAMKVLGLFGKMIKFLVEDFGRLRLNTCLQYLTVAESMDILDNTNIVRYRNVLVPDREVEGKKKTRRIEFTTDLPETEEQLEDREYKLLAQEIDEDMSIIQVNPELFRNLKYSVKVEADMLFSNSETVRKALNLEAYDRLIQNPNTDQQAVTRDFLLKNYVPGEEDNYIKKQQQGAMASEGAGGTSDFASMVLKGNMTPAQVQ